MSTNRATTPAEAGASADPAGRRIDVPRTSAEVVLAILIVCESARAFYSWYPSVGLVADGSLTNLGRLVWPALAAASGIAILRRPWLDRRPLDPLLVVLVAALCASVLWSVDPPKTLYQAIVFACVLTSAMFLATAFSRDELVVLVSTVLGLMCAASVPYILLGISNRGTQVTGIFEHKNILGLASAGAVLLLAARFLGPRRAAGRLGAVLLVASVLALFLSGSRSSQFGALLVLMLMGFVALRRHHQFLATALAAPTAAMYALLLWSAGGVGTILSSTGKSSDLTGRTDVWDAVTQLIGERPVVGWGYLAYWRDEGFANERSGFEEFGLRSAHNGYLEAALGAGVLTGVLVAVVLIVLIVRSYRRAGRPSASLTDLGLFGIAVFAAVVNFGESFFPASTRTLLTLLIAALSAGRMARDR